MATPQQEPEHQATQPNVQLPTIATVAENQKQMNKTMEMKNIIESRNHAGEFSSKGMGQSDDLEISVSQTKTVNVGKLGSTQ